MQLPDVQREALQRAYGFAEWNAKGTGDVRRARSPVLTPDLFPGWQLVKETRREAATPPRTETFWRPSEGRGETLIRVDLMECESVEAAREAVIDALGEFQANVFNRRTDLGVGDVIFGLETSLLFARANVVALVRNAGPYAVPVVEFSRVVDAAIVRAAKAER